MLRKIEVLHLAFNLLQCKIPTFLGNLTSLVSLNMKTNPFSPGEIPEELGNLQRLRELILTTCLVCNLVGKIPSTFGNLSEMGNMDLGSNLLSGNIPESLMALPKMWQLVLTCNTLSGQIPSNVGELKSMQNLDLSQNSLSGTIP
jgi:Leucine-rich repeat (LRR) protein